MTDDIEKRDLEAHVVLCAERYKNLDEKLDNLEERTSHIENTVGEIRDRLFATQTQSQEQDLARLAAIAEHNCLKMHSVMWGSRPPMMYWNSATVACMQTVRDLQADGVGVFFTIDAGPQLKAVCAPEYATQVRDALVATAGVTEVMVSGLGAGAGLVVA